MPHIFGHDSKLKWSERQDFHLRPPGPKPGALRLGYIPKKWRTRRELHPQPSRRQRGALLIELRVQMVGSAGNAPVRHFRLCFLTPDLQSGSRITSLENGSGSGSHTHLKKFMRLLSVHWSSFPQLIGGVGG
jgi:hypothetical protein